MPLFAIKKAYSRTELGEWSHTAPYPTRSAFNGYINDHIKYIPRELMNHPDLHVHENELQSIKKELEVIRNGWSDRYKNDPSKDWKADTEARNQELISRRNAIESDIKNRAEQLYTNKVTGNDFPIHKKQVREALPFYYPSMLFSPQHLDPSHTLTGDFENNTLHGIIDSGKFKNQYELMQERGENVVKDQGRDRIENMFHNGLSEHSPHADRPVYGYLDRVPHVVGLTPSSQRLEIAHHTFQPLLNYAGRHEFILHPHVLGRSTVSAGDSFMDTYVPHPVFDPHPATGITSSSYTGVPELDAHYNVQELQIHNGLKFPQDVAGVVFKGTAPARDVTDRLNQHGVKWALNPSDPYDPNNDKERHHNLVPLLLKYAPGTKDSIKDTYLEYEDRMQNVADSSPDANTYFKKYHNDSRRGINHDEFRNTLIHRMDAEPQHLVGEQAHHEIMHNGFPSFLGKRVGG